MSENQTPDGQTSERGTPEARNTEARTPEARAAHGAGAQGASRPAAAKIKIDMPADGSEPEPMRPAARLPRLPDVDAATGEVAAVPGEAGAGTSGEAAGSVPAGAKRAQAEQASEAHHPGHDGDLARTKAALEQAARTKPVLTRVFQVLIAACFPIVLLVLAIRLVTTNVFLWIEYHRPGFPIDTFGFSTDDRQTYGSYAVDYLLNLSGPRYLGDLVNDKGNPLFLAREVAHMHDVKNLITTAFLLGLVLAVVMVIGMLYLRRRSPGGIRRGLFAGSIATLVIIIVLGVLAGMGWETFFTDFHEMFFANGTWTFYTDDTLIRLFPSDFWSDAGIFIGAFVLVVSSLVMAFTWPTRSRRDLGSQPHPAGRRRA